MITFIRRQMQRVVFRVILLLIIIALAGFISLPRLLKDGPSDQWVVAVDGAKISQVDLQKQLATTMSELQQRFGAYAQQILSQLQLDIQTLALNSLVQNALIDRLANQLRVYLDDDSIMQKIMQTVPPEALDSSGRIDQQAFLNLFPQYKSFADFEKNIQDTLRREVVMSIAQGGFYVSQFDKKEQYISDYLGKKYTILVFPLEKYLAQEKTKKLSDKELEAFYKVESKKHKGYWSPEKRSGTVWEFTPKGFGIDIKEKTLESYYKKNKRKEFVKTPTELQVRRILFAVGKDGDEAQARKKAQEVQQKLEKDPKAFAQLAKKYSDDKDTAGSGGLVPFFSRGQKDPAFEKAAFRLRKKGDVSDLIKTQQGLGLIQRVDRRQESYKPFGQVKNQIKDMLEGKRFKGEFEAFLKQYLCQRCLFWPNPFFQVEPQSPF